MTNEEKREIVSEILSELRTNSVLIQDLTEVLAIPSGSFIELSNGVKISADTFKSVIQQAIIDDSVSGLIETERNARIGEDNSLSGRLDDAESDINTLSGRVDGIETSIEMINADTGECDNEKIELVFTMPNGNPITITLSAATANAAGLFSAANYQKLEGHDDDIEDLQDAVITGVSVEATGNAATLCLETHDETGHNVELPVAGTVPDGQDNPVAGIMTAGQAKDLEDIILEVFGLVASVTYSNAGYYEKGSTVRPYATLSITRRGVDVSSEATVVTPMTVEGNTLSYEAITENTSFNISVSHKGKTIPLPALQYRFVNYVFGEVLSDVPVDVANSLANARTLHELSTRTTYSGTLQAGKLFLFGVPGNVTLVCRHTETGAVIPCTTGTELVRRHNSDETDSYLYIIVPASDIDWNFTISNS